MGSRYTSDTTPTNDQTTVGAVTTVVVAVNSARVGGVFCNDSDEVIYLAFGADAVLNKGVRLNAGGGTFTMDGDLVFVGAINAICTSGQKNLCYTEFVEA